MTEEELVKKFESENITLSSLHKRAAAHVIDDIIITFFIFFAFNNMFTAIDMSNLDEVSALTYHLTPYIVLMKIVYQAFFVWMYGATVGKMAMKIRVVSISNGQRPNILLSLIRANIRLVSEAIFFVGFLWAFGNFKRQTWEDIAAKTLVVNA
ncbi:MAG: RDD family protein [Campylobacteraceae bacterium]|jgi:uncharacterized RDD family membrane protein YckC|nr:RDD family protein [Campylobacteraceae bacterium]